MEKLTLQWIANAVGGTLRGEGKNVARGVTTDSRSLRRGELFVALKGEQFDGHQFLDGAAQGGAAGAIVSSAWATTSHLSGMPLIVVTDTLVALQALARAYRQSRKNWKVIGVTGSNGKTTTKEAIATVMNKKYNVAKTAGNLNNHIGVPLSVLAADTRDEVGVFEMGINHAGEMQPLVEICKPQIGVITNIGHAHLEFLGDEAGVAQEKGMLLEQLPADGLALLNADDEWTDSLRERTDARVKTVGFAAEADVRADNVHWERNKLCFDLHFAQEEEVPSIWINAVGKHQIYSALFAAAAARELGLSVKTIERALKKIKAPEGRLKIETIRGVRFLNDSYNANPDSTRAALESLANLPDAKRRIAVLGDMHELGDTSESAHRTVGTVAASLDMDALLLVGEKARAIGEVAIEAGVLKERVHFFRSAAEAGAALVTIAQRGDTILVKASRAARLEEVIGVFRKQFKKGK